jgi:hypothetical protein
MIFFFKYLETFITYDAWKRVTGQRSGYLCFFGGQWFSNRVSVVIFLGLQQNYFYSMALLSYQFEGKHTLIFSSTLRVRYAQTI